MTASSYNGYPFRTLGWRQLQLIKDGTSPERARSRLDAELASGILELKQPLPFRRLHSRSRGELDIETTVGRLIHATDLEACYRDIPAPPGMLGPTVLVTGALREQIMARIRELGGAYVVSPDGVACVLPTADEPVENQPEPAPPSIEQQGIKLLAERLRRHQARGYTKKKAFYRTLLKRVLDLSAVKFNVIVWPVALKEPGVKPPKSGAPKKKK